MKQAHIHNQRVMPRMTLVRADGHLEEERSDPATFKGLGDHGASANGVAVPSIAAATRGVPGVSSTTGIALADWDDLFRAVTARLKLSVDGRRDATLTAHAGDSVGMATGVLECVEALEQLRLTITSELGRWGELERAAPGLRVALERAQIERACAQAREQRARHEALHDSLMSRTNGRRFRARLSRALNRPASSHVAFGLLGIDPGTFKPVNDRCGHLAGATLLRIVGKPLTCCVRPEDVVSRIGGDALACIDSGLGCVLFDERGQACVASCKFVEARTALIRPPLKRR